MIPAERWTHHLANLLVGGTGLAYAVVRYAMEPQDPYAVVNHPAQPHLQHLHILVAPVLVFAVGLSWFRHVAPRLRQRLRRSYTTGLSLALSFVPMVVSGSLIQVAVEPSWRQIWVAVHLISSGLWVLGYLVHQLQSASEPRPPGPG